MTDDTLRADLAAANGAGLVGFQQLGTGAIPRTSLDKIREWISVQDYGAKGDTNITQLNVTIAAGSKALTAAGGAFTEMDVGKTIGIPGGGASGASLVTTIAGYTSPTQISLTVAASTAIAGVATWITYGTDDTAAIQACLTAAGSNSMVYILPGTYLLSATLTGYNNQHIFGAGPNTTILRRITDYGNTISFANGGAVTVRGIWFWHGDNYNAGDTALDYFVASSTSHLDFMSCQGVLVRDCWFWRMPYSISLESGALYTIENCNFAGTFDSTYAQCKEGVAYITVGRTAYTQIVKINNCYFGGSSSAARNVTYTSSDTGAHVVSMTQAIGSNYAIEVLQCEDLLISGNYMGGNAISNIRANLIAGSTSLDWRILGNFIDSAGYNAAMIAINTQANGTAINGVTIANNIFNGELQSFQAISVYNGAGSQSILNNFTITGNTFQAIVGSAIMLYHVAGGTVCGNSISGYNARQVTAGGDLTYCAGVFGGATSSGVMCSGNVLGGLTNTDLAPSYCYSGVVSSNGTFIARDNVWNGVGSTGTAKGRVDKSVVTVTSNYTMLGNEDVVYTNTTSATLQITPPSNPATGYTFTIKDVAGTAGTHAVQLVATVDGIIDPIYGSNYFNTTISWTGSGWATLAGTSA